MQKAKTVLYIDAKGFEHEALVTALNGLHEGYVSLVYVDDKAEERENLVKVFDVPHMSDDSRQEQREVPASDQSRNRGVTVLEGNAHLPTYHVNCWKELGEAHKAFPADHAQFDHPFEEAKFDEHGQHHPKARPEFENDILEHLTGPVDQADGATGAVVETPIEQNLRCRLASQKAALESFAKRREEDTVLIAELKQKNDQLEAAVDQGSEALFAKDAEKNELDQTNQQLVAEIEKLKAAIAAASPNPENAQAAEPAADAPSN